MKIENIQILSKTVTAGNNTISFTDKELDNIYKIYENNSALTVTFVLTTASNYTNTKTCNVILKGNQKNGYKKVSNIWKRCKRYKKINGEWVRVLRWKKINGIWERCI